MSELKAGDSRSFTIGDKLLTIEPVPYGNVKKIFRIVAGAMQDITGGKNALEDIPNAIDKYLPEFLPLLFRKGTHDFVTPEWIDDNLTLTGMREIVEAAIKVNGLEDFFARQKAAAQAVKVETSSSFTTSSDSATGGSPTK